MCTIIASGGLATRHFQLSPTGRFLSCDAAISRLRTGGPVGMGAWGAVFLPAVFGSAIQELAYWWQLRFKLSNKKYQEQMRSVAYWVVVIAMVIGSGIGTVF